jgi:hypothetical protein
MLATTKYYPHLLLGTMALTISMATLLPAIATAPMPPQLVISKLNGRSVNILYLTRSRDKVLVRCYPGLKPTIVVKNNTDGTKEGTLTCKT